MHIRVSVVAGVVAAGLIVTADVPVRGQAPAQGPAEQTPPGPPLRVGVDAVRIDAVVTDRDGRIVPGLTADDFEVRQDGKLQRISFVDYIPIRTGPALASPAQPPGTPAASTSPAGPRAAPVTRDPVKPGPVQRDDIQRTLAIVVDDLGLSFESFHGMQGALHSFVDREIRRGDLVAIVRTSGAGGGLQPFTADPRILHSVIDGLGWNGRSRNAVEPYEAINQWTTFGGGGPAPAPSEPQPGAPAGANQLRASGSAFGASTLDPNDFTALNRLRASSSAAGSLGALNLVVRGARELPGRKAVILVTEGFSMQDADGLDSRVRAALDRVVDQALRAGVVIYSLDPRGLQTAGLLASDNLKSASPEPGQFDAAVRAAASARVEFNRDTQEGMAYLAEQTGGFSVLNTNDLPWGLGRIINDVREYYIIGYVPAEGTFARPGQKPDIHRISIRTKRPGLRVKTRREFLGVSDPPADSGPLTPAQQLVHAATSPFAAPDVALRATTLPGFSEEKGLFVRALLHIDARPLTFVDSEGGKKTASVDVLGMVFDREGTEVAHLSTGFAMGLTKEGADAALGDGIAYVLRIPIPRAGGYQVRFAVRDQHSGLTGAAGEFVDVDDIPGGAFALSGIVLRPDERGAAASKVPDDIALSPAQALGVYRPGTRLAYAYEIYNAEAPVQAAASIWRGSDRILSVPPVTLVPPPGGGRRFAAAGGVRLGDKLPPGTYILEIAAANPDPRRARKNRVAVQRVSFDVR